MQKQKSFVQIIALIFILLFAQGLAREAFCKPIEFVVITPSYNNEAYLQGNLHSIISQTYPYWKLVYINDCSTDHTGRLADEFLRAHTLTNKARIVHNKKNVGAMANLYKWIHKAKPNQVIVHLDGDDRFAHAQVLERLAFAYADRQVWLTYGSYKAEPDSFHHINAELPEWVLKENAFRRYDYVTSHLKSFYAKLFHNIKKKHLKYKRKFVSTGSDVAYMFPMLEQASRGHILFIREVLYIYNYQNPLNDHKNCNDLRELITKRLKGLKPYKPLKKLFR